MLFVLLLILVIGGGFRFYRTEQLQVQQEVARDLTAIGRLKADQLTKWRQDRYKDARLLLNNPFFMERMRAFLTAGEIPPTAELADLFSLIRHHDYANIALVDARGEVIFQLDNGPDAIEEADYLFLEALNTGNITLVDLHRHAAETVPHMSTVVPIPAVDNPADPIGAVVLVTDATDFLFPLISNWPVPSGSAETELVRREGEGVLFLNELRHDQNAALDLQLPLTRTESPAVMAALGQEGFVFGQDYRGVDVVAVLLPVPDSNWTVVAKMDAEEAFTDWQDRSLFILTILFGAVGLLVSGGVLFWQRSRTDYFQAQYRAEAAYRMEMERHKSVLWAIGDGVIVSDAHGRVAMLNPVAEKWTGWERGEAYGRPLAEILHLIRKDSGEPIADPLQLLREKGKLVGLTEDILLLSRSGGQHTVVDNSSRIYDEDGSLNGIVIVFREAGQEQLLQQLMHAVVDLVTYSTDRSLDEILQRALDAAGQFVDSPLGFFHFVAPDQVSLSLQQWSTRTLNEFCQAEAKWAHYPIDEAGVWVDCVRQRRPVIHNDYQALPHKKGLPPGHAQVIRELVVPIMRQDKVVAILGIGNKPDDYTDQDVEIITFFADVIWQIVENKQASERLEDNQSILARAEEVAQMGSWKWDLRTEKVTWSEGMYRIFDLDPEHFDGDLQQVVAQRIHPDDVARVEVSNRRVVTEGKPEPMSYRIIQRDGTVLTLWAHGELVFDETGKPVTLTGYVQDISERRAAEKEREQLLGRIQLQAQQLQEIMEGVPDGILLLDGEQRLVRTNPAADRKLEQLTAGFEGARLMTLGGRPLAELLRPPQDGLWHELIVGRQIFELRFREVEEGLFAPGWVLMLREVTSQRHTEEQLQRQERLAAVGQLAAGIAHDFNNLMAVIMLHAQLLEVSLELDPTSRERLSTIVNQTERAAQLIQQILDFSRRATIEKRPLPFRPLLKEQVKLLQRTLPEHIEITLNADEADFFIEADPARLQQVIINLAFNARDAMPQGGSLTFALDARELSPGELPPLSTMPPGRWVHLAVSDSGTGINPQILSRIFDPFFTTKPPGKGNGLGLAQVYGIVSQHNGFIDVSSRPDEGATFDIYLPAVIVEEPALPPVADETVRYGRGHLLLVVEDEPALREAMVDTLTIWQYDVLAAGDGQMALELISAASKLPDLIISDLVMPNLGGIEFVRRLRGQDLHIPVIFISGHPLDLDLSSMDELGIFASLFKPIDPGQLNRTLANALRLS